MAGHIGNHNEARDSREPTSDTWMRLFIAGIIAVTFAIDILTPSGIAAGIFPYYFAIYLSSRSPSHYAPFVVAGIASALTLIGFIATTGGRPDIILINRLFIIATLWLTAALAYNRITKEKEIIDQRAAAEYASRYHDLVDNARLGIQIANHSAERVMVNKALADLLGYSSVADERVGGRGVALSRQRRPPRGRGG